MYDEISDKVCLTDSPPKLTIDYMFNC